MRYFLVSEYNKADLEKIKQKVTINDLPYHLQDIAEIIGVQCLLKLVEHYKGKKVYIPKKKRTSKVHGFMASDSFAKLCEVYGGDYLDFRKSDLRRTFNQIYLADLRQEYINNDCSLQEFVTRYNLSKKVKNTLYPLKKKS